MKYRLLILLASIAEIKKEEEEVADSEVEQSPDDSDSSFNADCSDEDTKTKTKNKKKKKKTKKPVVVRNKVKENGIVVGEADSDWEESGVPKPDVRADDTIYETDKGGTKRKKGKKFRGNAHLLFPKYTSEMCVGKKNITIYLSLIHI